MPDYQIKITRTAQKQLDKLADAIAEILISGINDLRKNPRPAGYKKLKARDGYRIRKGDYRIIYDIYDKFNC
jgi:mRNA interferase RelE/StbE